MVTPVALCSIGWRYYIVFVAISACVPLIVLPFVPETMNRNLELIDKYSKKLLLSGILFQWPGGYHRVMLSSTRVARARTRMLKEKLPEPSKENLLNGWFNAPTLAVTRYSGCEAPILVVCLSVFV